MQFAVSLCLILLGDCSLLHLPTCRLLVTISTALHAFMEQNICDLWYRRVDIPSYQCKPGETIGVHSQKQSKALVDSWKDASSRPMPPHLSRSSESTGAQVTSIVNRQDVALSINELLIVEYYSRKM